MHCVIGLKLEYDGRRGEWWPHGGRVVGQLGRAVQYGMNFALLKTSWILIKKLMRAV